MRRLFDRMNVPTELARAFVTLSETQSFTRTAKMLGVTQPAVTGQIKRLEGIVGEPLLERGAPGVELSSVGRLVLGHARDLLDANKRIMSVAGLGSPTACRIALAQAFLEPFLEDFTHATDRPNIHIKCVPSEEVARLLHAGQADVGVLLLFDSSLNVVVEWPEDLIWVKSESLEISEADPLPIVASPTKYSDRLMMEALDRLGVRYEVVVACADYNSRLAAARLGMGVMIAFARTDYSPLVVVKEDWLPSIAKMRAAVCLRRGLKERSVSTVLGAMRRGYVQE